MIFMDLLAIFVQVWLPLKSLDEFPSILSFYLSQFDISKIPNCEFNRLYGFQIQIQIAFFHIRELTATVLMTLVDFLEISTDFYGFLDRLL